MSTGIERNRITVTFTNEEYENLKTLAARNKISMSEQVRSFTAQGLAGRLTENNLDLLAPVLREQIRCVLEPQIERLATISSKACIQSGAAAYLTAEVLSSFLPPELRQDLNEAYTKARKKSVEYMRKKNYEE
jgi:hypothetical protein